jgi:hypothetical protein
MHECMRLLANVTYSVTLVNYNCKMFMSLAPVCEASYEQMETQKFDLPRHPQSGSMHLHPNILFTNAVFPIIK